MCVGSGAQSKRLNDQLQYCRFSRRDFNRQLKRVNHSHAVFGSIHSSNKKHLWRGAGIGRITFIYCLCMRKTTSSWNIPVESEIMPFLLDSSSYQTSASTIRTLRWVNLLFSSACLIFAVCFAFVFCFSPAVVHSRETWKKDVNGNTRKPDISNFSNSLPALAK